MLNFICSIDEIYVKSLVIFDEIYAKRACIYTPCIRKDIIFLSLAFQETHIQTLIFVYLCICVYPWSLCPSSLGLMVSFTNTHRQTLSLSLSLYLSLSLPKLKSSVLRWKLQVKLICIFVRFISFQTLEKSSKILLPLVWQRSKSLQSGLILREITN